mmetsp:Transcript_34933/g.79911  ORF Transcript_34933/g.79911 Transcript_34933/m.79911 type:complete len:236 (-) Transcript_34933:230-937(-)
MQFIVALQVPVQDLEQVRLVRGVRQIRWHLSAESEVFTGQAQPLQVSKLTALSQSRILQEPLRGCHTVYAGVNYARLGVPPRLNASVGQYQNLRRQRAAHGGDRPHISGPPAVLGAVVLGATVDTQATCAGIHDGSASGDRRYIRLQQANLGHHWDVDATASNRPDDPDHRAGVLEEIGPVPPGLGADCFATALACVLCRAPQIYINRISAGAGTDHGGPCHDDGVIPSNLRHCG